MEQTLLYAMQILNILPAMLQAGQDVLTLVNQGKERLQAMQNENRDPSDADWAELNDQIYALQIKLHEGENDKPDAQT